MIGGGWQRLAIALPLSCHAVGVARGVTRTATELSSSRGPAKPHRDVNAYLVCHDYGMGGLWWWIAAGSPEAIRRHYADVVVFEGLPDWASGPDDPRLANIEHVALGDKDARGDRVRQGLRDEAQERRDDD